MLKSTFLQVQSGKQPLQWSLKGIPEVGFHQVLHPFLKRWPITHGKTKQAIGSFYIAIDHNLKEKGSRADNVYRFVEGICKSGQPSSALVQYGFDQGAMDKHEVKSMQLEVEECREQVPKYSHRIL